MYTVLFNRWNIEKTREYLNREHDLGVNIPVWHFEEQSFRKLSKYKFLTATFTWNKRGNERGLYVVEGEYTIDNKGIATITNSGILVIWESLNGKQDKQFKFNWLCDNSELMRELVRKHYL